MSLYVFSQGGRRLLRYAADAMPILPSHIDQRMYSDQALVDDGQLRIRTGFGFGTQPVDNDDAFSGEFLSLSVPSQTVYTSTQYGPELQSNGQNFNFIPVSNFSGQIVKYNSVPTAPGATKYASVSPSGKGSVRMA